MVEARAKLKDLQIGQQDVLVFVAEANPALDRLTFITRWKNAWVGKNSDPEFTELVEKAAAHFADQKEKMQKRLGQQRLRATPIQ